MRAGTMLRQARRRAGLTQRAVAQAVGVPQSTVARIERGVVDPRTETLIRLLRACGEDLDVVPRLGVGEDRTLSRELLEMTPDQRLERIAAGGRWLRAIERARSAKA
ncbi:MAG: helix-turn-helix domain-containing protein [Actinomycetota bacterium]|nr:helix-turn-helix domain-containing protein [Actinomycetota bacterium]